MARDKRPPPGRRRPGEGSWHTTPSGVRWRVPVGQDSAGKAILKDFYGRDEAEARAKHDAWQRAHPHGAPSSDQAQPLNDLLATWVGMMHARYAVSTYEDTLSVIRLHIAPYIGRTPLYQLSTIAIDAWLAERYAAHGHGRVIERALHILRAALKQAVIWKLIPENPATNASMPRFRRRKARALTFVEAQALLAAANGRLDLRKPYRTRDGKIKHWPRLDARLAALYVLALTLGLRKGELLALRWGAYDERAGTLEIRASLDTKGRERAPKTEDSLRVIELDPHVQELLRRHRAAMQAEPHGEGWRPDGLMFPTERGTAMTQRNLDRHFKSVLTAAGLPETIRFHDLRHSAGSLMLAEGGSLVDVSHTLGHATPETTRRIYAHSYKEGRRRSVAGVSRRLLGDGDGADERAAKG